MQLPPRIVQPALLYFVDFTLGTKRYGHRAITRIIVHVAHNDDFYLRIFFLQFFFEGSYLMACQLTVIRDGATTGPMADYNSNMLA